MRKTIADDFKELCYKINIATHSPVDPCSKLGGTLVHNKGHFFVDKAPTADSLYRIWRVTDVQGSRENPLGMSPMPAQELKGFMLVFLLGLVFNRGG